MLSTPPAFILSQDQTLLFNLLSVLLTFICFPYYFGSLHLFSCNSSLDLGLIFSYQLFSFQGSLCHFVNSFFAVLADSLIIISDVQAFVKNFFIYFFGGEGGIWTHAPLLTVYSLSRGAPSTTWVLLHKALTEKMIKMAERVGFEPTAPFGVTGFQDQLLKPLGHLSTDFL